jgi:hypothetical protein
LTLALGSFFFSLTVFLSLLMMNILKDDAKKATLLQEQIFKDSSNVLAGVCSAENNIALPELGNY